MGLLDLEEIEILPQVGQVSFVLEGLVMGLLQGGFELLNLLFLLDNKGLVLGSSLVSALPLAFQINLEGRVFLGQGLVAGKRQAASSDWSASGSRRKNKRKQEPSHFLQLGDLGVQLNQFAVSALGQFQRRLQGLVFPLEL